jgi:hypothetical protein
MSSPPPASISSPSSPRIFKRFPNLQAQNEDAFTSAAKRPRGYFTAAYSSSRRASTSAGSDSSADQQDSTAEQNKFDPKNYSSFSPVQADSNTISEESLPKYSLKEVEYSPTAPDVAGKPQPSESVAVENDEPYSPGAAVTTEWYIPTAISDSPLVKQLPYIPTPLTQEQRISDYPTIRPRNLFDDLSRS